MLKLVTALYARQLTDLCPDSSEEAQIRYADMRDQGLDKGNFEPLWVACFAILMNAERLGGNIDPCPICSDPSREDWIELAADNVREVAIEIGFSFLPH
jgi:hypothetical protein